MANVLLVVIGIGLLGMKIYAFADCIRRPAAAFPAYGKLSKPAWLVITVLSVLTALSLNPIGILSLAGTVGAIVYLVDVKPAVSGANQ
jgi:hypothetical protein